VIVLWAGLLVIEITGATQASCRAVARAPRIAAALEVSAVRAGS